MFFCDVNIPSNLGYVCYRNTFEDGYVSRPHWHGFIELEFFVEGGGVHHCNNQTFQIYRNAAWVLSTDDRHQLSLNKGTKNVNLAVNPDVLHPKLLSYLSSFHPLYCAFNEMEAQHILRKVDILCKEQEEPRLLSQANAAAIINEVFVEIARKSSNDPKPVNNTLVNNMLNYMQAHYKESISLAELARTFSFTPNYLGHLFKKVVGISFNDYLNNLRVKHACKLLLNSNYDISEIAFDSGFHSVKHFYTTFKNFYGITPAKYRNMSPNNIMQKSKRRQDMKV